jgi:hypothetical protein
MRISIITQKKRKSLTTSFPYILWDKDMLTAGTEKGKEMAYNPCADATKPYFPTGL